MGFGIFGNIIKKKPFKDPVCGMRAADQTTVEYKGQNFYFCSDHCRQQFADNPEKYAVNAKLA